MFWKKSDKGQEKAEPEQAVVVSFDVDSSEYEGVSKQIATLTDELESALQQIGAEYDGDEYGDKECNLYFYGPDAEKIYDLVSKALAKLPIRPIRFKLRFGDVNDPSAKEEKRRLV